MKKTFLIASLVFASSLVAKIEPIFNENGDQLCGQEAKDYFERITGESSSKLIAAQLDCSFGKGFTSEDEGTFTVFSKDIQVDKIKEGLEVYGIDISKTIINRLAQTGLMTAFGSKYLGPAPGNNQVRVPYSESSFDQLKQMMMEPFEMHIWFDIAKIEKHPKILNSLNFPDGFVKEQTNYEITNSRKDHINLVVTYVPRNFSTIGFVKRVTDNSWDEENRQFTSRNACKEYKSSWLDDHMVKVFGNYCDPSLPRN